MSSVSYVVTGGARGIGRVISERLARDAYVVVVDTARELGWSHERVELISGDASTQEVATGAASTAESHAPLTGWVNNAASFRHATLDGASAREILELVTANLAPAVAGCHTAVNHFLLHARQGAILNISSHQAQRPVRGALPYATAKAAPEGLPRAVAVDHGPDGIRTNAIALGSISTARPSTSRSRLSTPSGASGPLEKSRKSLRSSCRTWLASSTVSCSLSTVDVRFWGATQRHGDPR
jgi:NAD(P)-dependent dehydrogenase (short-subunit alcohol dehydrogenase family)